MSVIIAQYSVDLLFSRRFIHTVYVACLYCDTSEAYLIRYVEKTLDFIKISSKTINREHLPEVAPKGLNRKSCSKCELQRFTARDPNSISGVCFSRISCLWFVSVIYHVVLMLLNAKRRCWYIN